MSISMSRLPWYWQIGIFLGIAAAGTLGFHRSYVVPLQEARAAGQHRLRSLQTDVQRGAAIAARLPGFQQEVAELEDRLEDLETVLPEQKDVGDLLRRIQMLAMQSNLTITGFKPQAVTTRELHAEWPIALELDGTYHNLGRFFEKVSRVSRIININTLTIQAKERPDPHSTISAECTATTFVLLEPTQTATAGR